MKNWTIRGRVLASFALIVGLMIATAMLGYGRLHRVQTDALRLQQSSLRNDQVNAVRRAAMEHYVGVERFVVSPDPALRAAIDQALRDLQDRLDATQDPEAASAETQERPRTEALGQAAAAYRRAAGQVLDAGSERAGAAAGSIGLLREAFESLQAAINALDDRSHVHARDSLAQIRDDAAGAVMALVASSAIAVVLAALCAFFLLRAITQPLNRLVGLVNSVRQGDFTQRLRMTRQDEMGLLAGGFDRMSDELTGLVGQVQKSGLQVDTSVTEIAATAKEHQATAAEIAATTTEIGATSREISATSKDLLKTMNDVATVAERSGELAGSSQAGLTRMEETMRHVMEAAGVINAKLGVLSEKAGNIGQVVTTITKVADQTNLLSLNAAIEAEKAGEYGRGFAVVATEIRRLADQTAVATYDIEQMVKEIQSAVAAGVMGMDKFSEEVRRGADEIREAGTQLTQLIEQVQTLPPRFEIVTEGMQAQATGAEQISQALVQLGEASQQTVESLRQSSEAIQDLNRVAGALRSGVSRFRLEAAA